jgi:hypothetical protein
LYFIDVNVNQKKSIARQVLNVMPEVQYSGIKTSQNFTPTCRFIISTVISFFQAQHLVFAVGCSSHKNTARVCQ